MRRLLLLASVYVVMAFVALLLAHTWVQRSFGIVVLVAAAATVLLARRMQRGDSEPGSG